jgi:hypothetical protein
MSDSMGRETLEALIDDYRRTHPEFKPPEKSDHSIVLALTTDMNPELTIVDAAHKTNHSQTAAFIWSVADLLRGDFKQNQYGRVILLFTLLRRLAVCAGAHQCSGARRRTI